MIELFVYGLITVGILGIFFMFSRSSLRVIPYLYANARIEARSKKIFDQSKLKGISESKSLNEFCSKISESYPVKSKEDIYNIHNSIEEDFHKEILELQKMSPKTMQPLYRSYLMFIEAKILKMVFRKKVGKIEMTQDELPSIGIFNKILNEKISVASRPDLKVILSYTPYGKIFEEEYESPKHFDMAIDKLVMDNFLDSINSSRIYDRKSITDIMKISFEIKGLMMILRSINREEDAQIRKDMINSSLNKLQKIASSMTIEQFVENTKGTQYHSPIKEAYALYSKDKGLYHFEVELNRYYKNNVLSKKLSHYQGPYHIFTYMTQKEFEMNNLFAISKGIHAGFSSKHIQEMVI
jgi:vacuolar-type H+-ATPase subunit C/Vma6